MGTQSKGIALPGIIFVVSFLFGFLPSFSVTLFMFDIDILLDIIRHIPLMGDCAEAFGFCIMAEEPGWIFAGLGISSVVCVITAGIIIKRLRQ